MPGRKGKQRKMWEDNIQERTGLISSLLRGQQKHIKIAGAVEKTSVMLQPQHGYGVEEEVLLLPHCSINDDTSSVLLRSNLIIPWVITLGSQLQSGCPTKDHYYYMFNYNPCEHEGRLILGRDCRKEIFKGVDGFLDSISDFFVGHMVLL